MNVSSDKLYTKHYTDKTILSEKEKQAKYLIDKTKSLAFKERETVLDVGCGAGILASILSEKFKVRSFGIDANKNGIVLAKKNGVKAVVGNIEKEWPFKKSSFDYVFSVQVIEHVLNTDFHLLQTKRVLKKDGYFILTTPNLNFWLNRIIFLFGYQPFFTEISMVDKTFGLDFTRKLTKNREPLGHIRVFSQKALLDMLNYYDFEIIKVIGGKVNYLPGILGFFDNIFSNIPSLSTDLIVISKKR